MNTQRKRIKHNIFTSNVTENAQLVVTMPFTDSASVNIHGLNVSMGMSPFGPDETAIGRWYVILLPASIANNTALRAEWVDNLNTTALANTFLASAGKEIWGAGQFICSSESPWLHTFKPSTSRNVENEGELFVIMTVDQVSGVVDDYDLCATINLFTS